MKKAIGRAVNYAARNPLLSLGKILVLNMDHYDRTILKLNRVLYHHVFKKSVWPPQERWRICHFLCTLAACFECGSRFKM
jgi:hypothetical protein